MKNWLTILMTATTLLIVLGALVWQTERLPGQKKPEIKTIKVERGEIIKTISASGKIVAQNKATLRFQTSGMITWVGVKKGDRVRKGQAIASLDKRELEKTFQKYANDYLSERWDFEQTQEDYQETKERQLVTDAIQRILDKAQYDLNKAVLDYEIKDLAVKYATLYSPIEGIVTNIEIPIVGVNVTPATAEFTIANPASVYFEASVDEVDIGVAQTGQVAQIVLDTYPDQVIESEVRRVDFTATATSGGGTAFMVELALPENEGEKYKLGMNGDVDIMIVARQEILIVPLSAVFEREDKTYIWLVENGRTVKREIETGVEADENIEVLLGLAQGDTVIAKDTSKIKEGEKVNF